MWVGAAWTMRVRGVASWSGDTELLLFAIARFVRCACGMWPAPTPAHRYPSPRAPGWSLAACLTASPPSRPKGRRRRVLGRRGHELEGEGVCINCMIGPYPCPCTAQSSPASHPLACSYALAARPHITPCTVVPPSPFSPLSPHCHLGPAAGPSRRRPHPGRAGVALPRCAAAAVRRGGGGAGGALPAGARGGRQGGRVRSAGGGAGPGGRIRVF